VLCFTGETAHAFEPDATLLKGLTVFSFAPSEVSTFSVDAPGLRETIRRNADGNYQLEEPKGFKHDGELVADAVQTLGALQAKRWVATADDPSFGLGAPRLRVSITLTSDPTARQLTVGAATAGGFFARASTDPGVFVLPAAVVRELSAPLIERTLLPAPEAELTRIRVEKGGRSLTSTRAGEQWRGDIPSGLLEATFALKAEYTAHLGAAKAAEGFDRPATIVRFTTSDGQTRQLSIGASDTLNDSPIHYARLDGIDATFAISARAAAMLRDSLDSEYKE
jgi:hypothetical protein